MKATKAKPRFASIISTDWPALFCLISIPGIWIIGFLFPFVRKGASFGTFEVLAFALPISMVAGGFLLWRIARIHRLFAFGRLVPAQVTSLRIARDRGRLEFEYDFGGLRRTSWMPVHKNKRVLALEPNQQVEVLVDPRDPTNAIVRQLYV
jgi:hypothetical protein